MRSGGAEEAVPVEAGPDGQLPVPRYGGGSLADLLPSVLHGLGVHTPDGPPALALPPADRVCVLLVDGLGLELLRQHRDVAPFLGSLLDTGVGLTAGFPSTTATSLPSLGTGLPPGVHGMLGYEMFVPAIDRVMNCLTWDRDVDPVLLQPRQTAFERAAAAGVAVTRIGPRKLDGTGLTLAGLRGGRHAGAESAGERVLAARAALREGDRSLVYVYYGDLDATGHRVGCASPAWRYQLAHVDLLAAQLAAALPEDAVLLVTADHGMVDVPPDGRWDLATTPVLDAGVRLIAGEPRAVYVHTVDGAADEVLAAWRETLGDTAWVLSRDEAVAAGWFGPQVADLVLPRIGDVVVAARGPVAVFDSRRARPEVLALVGLHGSLTPAELDVPLLVAPRG